MEEWKEYSLSDIAKYSQGKQIPINLQFEKEDNSLIRFIRIVDYTSNWKQSPRYVAKDPKYQIKFDDIVMIRYGTPGKVFRGHEGLIANNMFKISVNEDIIEKGYAYWYLSMEQVFKQLMSIQASTTMPAISFGMLKNITINVPNKNIQKKIVSILDNIDDKIEVNRRINEQLEELAGALFKSWFVDFEPFKDGEFVDSELGMIPKGWKVGTLEELIEIKYGKDHKKLSDGNIPVFGSGGIMRYVDKSLYEGESVLIPRKGTLNNVMYVNRDFWTVDTMFFSKMKMKDIAIFVYLFLSKKDLASMNSGSAVPSMTVEILNRISLVIPSNNVFEDFNRIVSSLFSQMDYNTKEIAHLTTLRDTLLPKLMSGEIDVNEVEI